MIDMVRKEIIPAVCEYTKILSETALSKRELIKDLPLKTESELIKKLALLTDDLFEKVGTLENAVEKVSSFE